MPGGDPAVLNDVGNDRMSDGMRLRESWGRVAAHASLPAAATGTAGEGTGVEAAWGEAMENLGRTMENLAATLEDDGYHLQRASLEIDTAMNRPGTGPGTGGGPQPVPV